MIEEWIHNIDIRRSIPINWSFHLHFNRHFCKSFPIKIEFKKSTIFHRYWCILKILFGLKSIELSGAMENINTECLRTLPSSWPKAKEVQTIPPSSTLPQWSPSRWWSSFPGKAESSQPHRSRVSSLPFSLLHTSWHCYWPSTYKEQKILHQMSWTRFARTQHHLLEHILLPISNNNLRKIGRLRNPRLNLFQQFLRTLEPLLNLFR